MNEINQEPYGDPESDPCDLWGPKPRLTMSDLMCQTKARQDGSVCWTKTCWCGHLMPDWMELCFTCAPADKQRWVDDAEKDVRP